MPVGIDVGSESLEVFVSGRSETENFSNNGKGYKALARFLRKLKRERKAIGVRIAMEATGVYSLEAALYFAGRAGFSVYVLNPSQAKSFGESKLSRIKTDASDARLLAELAERDDLQEWKAPDAVQAQIKTLEARRMDLVERLNALQNRLHALLRNPLRHNQSERSIEREIKFVEKEIDSIDKETNDLITSNPEWKGTKNLIESIPGVGTRTTMSILSTMGTRATERPVKAWVAYAGLDPSHHQSGTSVNWKSHISKKGDRRLRNVLYMAALVATRYNPAIKAFYEKLLSNGKAKKLALTACSRKLLHIIYGVLKNNCEFDRDFYSSPLEMKDGI